jgi:hypothetical protein
MRRHETWRGLCPINAGYRKLTHFPQISGFIREENARGYNTPL